MRIFNFLAAAAISVTIGTSAAAQPDANARVQKACATGQREACMAQIHLEEVCAQYRGAAMNAFGYKAARVPIADATRSMLENQQSLIPGIAVANLVHAAYSGQWIIDQDFAREAYKRCLNGKPF